MGQKVNPTGLRLGINKDWMSSWYADEQQYTTFLKEDLKMREYIAKQLSYAGISKIMIHRSSKLVTLDVYVSKPGVVIGKRGVEIENLKVSLANMTSSDVAINVLEVRKPDADAQLIAHNIATQLEKRVAFRRAMKFSIQKAMRAGAKGIKISCSGRLGGVELARSEWYKEGRVPLHTLRANIDYAHGSAHTTYGVIGIKVTVYHGDTLVDDKSHVKNAKNS